MKRLRGNIQKHLACWTKDFALDAPGFLQVPANSLYMPSTDYLNVEGFKNFTMSLTVFWNAVITGSEIGVAFKMRPNDTVAVNSIFLPLKTNLAFADFRNNPVINTYYDWTFSFGGNALNYPGYCFTNLIPYIKTTGDNFRVLFWTLTCLGG